MLHIASNNVLISEKSAPKPDAGKAEKLIKFNNRKRKFKKRLHEGQDEAPRKPIPVDESEYSLCVLLWQSTIVQALYDLASNTNHAEGKAVKAEAASWFFSDDDFLLVCELACLCPSNVRQKAAMVLKQGEKALEGFNFRTVRRDLSDRKPTKRMRRTMPGGRV